MGRSTGEKNIEAFKSFITERERLKDWGDYVAPDRSRLQRGKIVKACGFSRSALLQNRAVAGCLLRLEKDLRRRYILKGKDEETSEDLLKLEMGRDENIQNLENRTEVLESSIGKLRKSIEAVEQQLDEILLS